MKAPANTLPEITRFRRAEIAEWSRALWGRRAVLQLAKATGFGWHTVYHNLKGGSSRAGECLLALEEYARSRGFVSALDFKDGLTRLEVIPRAPTFRKWRPKSTPKPPAPALEVVIHKYSQLADVQQCLAECEPSYVD